MLSETLAFHGHGGIFAACRMRCIRKNRKKRHIGENFFLRAVFLFFIVPVETLFSFSCFIRKSAHFPKYHFRKVESRG